MGPLKIQGEVAGGVIPIKQGAWRKASNCSRKKGGGEGT